MIPQFSRQKGAEVLQNMNNMVVKSPYCAILHNRTSSFSRSDRLVGFHLFIAHLHQKTICSARETFHPSTSIQRIFCMGHCLHISQINDQTIGSVWTAFQLNASTGARLAGSADEKSLGEKSCKVTDQRGTQWPPPLVRVFPTNE